MKTMKKRVRKAYLTTGLAAIIMAVAVTITRKKLAKIKISRAYRRADTPHFCAFCNGIVTTGDAYLNQPLAIPPVNPYVTDTALKSKSTTLLNIFSGKQSKPATATAAQEIVAKDALMPMVDGLANQVETIANQIAVAAGDVAAGVAWLTHVGFLPAGKGHNTAHTLKQRPSAKGTCLAEFPHAGRGVIYVARVALTTENVIPTQAQWSNNIPVHVTGLLISGGGLKTGNIVALQLGYILTTAGSGLPVNAVEKAIAPISTQSTKKKHQTPTYIFGSDPITWMPTILYMAVQ
jgi:hypothetical protein